MEPSRKQDRKLNEVRDRADDTADHRPLAVSIERDTPLKKTAFLVVLVWGVAVAKPFLLPVLIAGLLAFLMAPLHRLLHRGLKLPDWLAVVVSAVVLLSPLALLGYALVRQGQGLVEDFPKITAGIQHQFAKLNSMPLFRRFAGGGTLNVEQGLAKLSGSAGKGLGLLVGGLATVASVGSQGLLVFVFAIVMLSSRRHIRRSTERILGTNRSLRSAGLLDQVVDLMQRFLVARMIIVLVVGALACGALLAFRVKYGFFLGALVGITTLIPVVGFVLALVPTLIVAAVTGHSLLAVAGIALALVGVNSVDNYYLTPKLVGNRVNINALTSFIGLFAGGLLWGMWGMFLSVPVMGILRIAFSAVPGLQPWGELMSDCPEHEAEPATPEERASRAA